MSLWSRSYHQLRHTLRVVDGVRMPRGRKAGSTLKLWSEEEIEWLKNNYMNGDIKWMAEQLSRPYGGITHQLYQLRLSSSGKKLKELVPYKHVYTRQTPKEPTICRLPPFHPVMLGIYPSRAHANNGRIWGKRRRLILKMHDYMCVYCGDEANAVDHVIPINKGGTDHPDNLVAACMFCNSTLGDKTKHIVWINSYPQKLSTGN